MLCSNTIGCAQNFGDCYRFKKNALSAMKQKSKSNNYKLKYDRKQNLWVDEYACVWFRLDIIVFED